MAAPVIASKSENVSSTNALTNVVAAPSGITDGDLLLYILVLDGIASAITVPTGFTEITPTDGDKAPSSAAHLVVAFKIASSESGSYTSTWTTGQHSIGRMYRITGAVAGDEIHNPSSVNTGTVSPVVSTSFETDSNDELAFSLCAIDRRFGNSSEFGSGWSNEDYDETSGTGPEVSSGVSIKTVSAKGTATLDGNRTLVSPEEWTCRQLGIRSSVVRTLTHTTDSFIVKHFQTHTTDSILKKLDTELTHTTDSHVVIGVTLTHTTDSVLGERDPGFILTHTTDSLLKQSDIELTHTTDSLLNTILTVTHTTNSYLVIGVTVVQTTDSVLKKLDTEITHTTDSIVYLTKTITHDTDSVLKTINTLVTHDTDSVLKALDQIITHSTDSALREIDNILVHTTDSILKATDNLLTHTTDSHIVLPGIQTPTHTTDSVLKKLDIIISHTTDSLLTNIRGKRVIADLCVDETTTEELCVDDESEVDLCA